MSWQRRLVEFVCAGGALATQAGCPQGPTVNRFPDPCLRGSQADDDPACRACEDNGGRWIWATAQATAGGSAVTGHCQEYPRDAGFDGGHDPLPDAPRALPDAYIPHD